MQEKKEQVIRDGIGAKAVSLVSSLYIGQVLGVMITLCTFVFVTRELGASGYGIYTLAFGFSALIDSMQNFGIGAYLSRRLAKYIQAKDHESIMKTLFSGYFSIIPLAMTLSIVGILLSPFVASAEGISATPLMLACATLFFSVTEYVGVLALMGFGRGKLASFVSVLVDILQFSSIVTLVFLLGYGVNGAISGMLFGYIIGFFVSIYLVFRVASESGKVSLNVPSKSEIKSTMKYSMPLGLNNVLNYSLQAFGTVYLGFLLTKQKPATAKQIIGTYGAALTGLNLITVFYNTMSSALVPLFATAEDEKDPEKANNTYNRLLFYSLLITLPFIIYLAVIAGPGVHLFLKPEYASTGFYLTLIALGTMLGIFQFYLTSLVIAKGLTAKLFKYNAISTAIQYAALLVVAPFYGVIGTIFVIFIAGNVLDDLFLVLLSKKHLKLKFEYRKLALLFAGNLLLGLPISLALLLSNPLLTMVAGLVILLLVYPIIIVLLRLMDKNDLNLMNKIAERFNILGKPMHLATRYLTFLLRLRG